jgi:hypothetical protein
MLDLNKLSAQVRHAAFEWEHTAGAYAERRQQVLTTWQRASEHDFELVDKLLRAPQEFPWPLARPLEPLSTRSERPVCPQQWAVIATDGSQIAPSRHEVSPCYLINIGKIWYTYGTGDLPVQESEPFLYYREQDLYTQIKRQQVGVSEQHIGIERSLKEVEELAHLAEKASLRGLPVLAMIDGALLSLQGDVHVLSGAIQEQIYQRTASAFERIRRAQVPLCAYVSQSRRSEVIHFLRLERCPYPEALCDVTCQEEGQEPCGGMHPFPDRALWEPLLQPGERSPLFVTTQRLPDILQPHQTCFFYLHVGGEVARIEIPRWVADHPDWTDWVHTLTLAQVEKGMGYPIALAEAHHRAVVKSADRSQFYAMLSRKMVDAQVHVTLSPKELKKRGGIA